MSSQTKPKKTRAQLRAEEDEITQGCLLVKHLGEAFRQLISFGCPLEVRDIRLHALLVDADRACRILRGGLVDTEMAAAGLGYILPMKGQMHQILGQHTLALAAFQEADEILIAEDQKGSKTKNSNLEVLCEIGYIYLNPNQLEAAKRSFLRILARPGRIEANHRMNAVTRRGRTGSRRSSAPRTPLRVFPQLGKSCL